MNQGVIAKNVILAPPGVDNFHIQPYYRNTLQSIISLAINSKSGDNFQPYYRFYA